MVFENSNFNVTNFLNISSHLCSKYRKLTQKENTNSSFVEKVVLSINTVPGSVPGASLRYAHQQPYYAHSKFCSLSEGKSSPCEMADDYGQRTARLHKWDDSTCDTGFVKQFGERCNIHHTELPCGWGCDFDRQTSWNQRAALQRQ